MSAAATYSFRTSNILLQEEEVFRLKILLSMESGPISFDLPRLASALAYIFQNSTMDQEQWSVKNRPIYNMKSVCVCVSSNINSFATLNSKTNLQ